MFCKTLFFAFLIFVGYWILLKSQVITTSSSVVFLCHLDLLSAFVSSLSKLPHVNYARFQHESTIASKIRLWTFYYVCVWIFPYPKHTSSSNKDSYSNATLCLCSLAHIASSSYWCSNSSFQMLDAGNVVAQDFLNIYCMNIGHLYAAFACALVFQEETHTIDILVKKPKVFFA